METESSVGRARRATVGRSALGWIALLCLIGSGVFWLSLFVDLLAPATPWSPQALQAFLMVVAYALVLPLFWSMLLPSSPAGRLLQKTAFATPGYIAVVGLAFFLTYYAGQILLGWWGVQSNIKDTGSALWLTITSLIAGVFVPALSWTVVTPEQWIAQIEQARHVRRIEQAMRMEEAAMHAAYARAVTLLNADLTSLTISQRRELAGILGGFARVQQDALRSIAASWKDMYGVEAHLAVVPDQELIAGYRQVANLLTSGVDKLQPVLDYVEDIADDDAADYVTPDEQLMRRARRSEEEAAGLREELRELRERLYNDSQRSHQDAAPVIPATPPPVATEPPPPRCAAMRRDAPRYAAEYQAALAQLPGTWSAGRLAGVLGKPERTARDRIAAWEGAGLVGREQDAKGSFYFTECEEA